MSTCYDCGRNECDCQDQRLAAARAEGVREGREQAATYLLGVDGGYVIHSVVNDIKYGMHERVSLTQELLAEAVRALAPNTEETERHDDK